MHVGWRGYGGILRSVRVLATDPLHIAALHVDAQPEGPGGTLALRARLQNDRPEPAAGVLEVEIRDAHGETVAVLPGRPFSLAPGAGVEIGLSTSFDAAQAWSPTDPVLYQACAVGLVCRSGF